MPPQEQADLWMALRDRMKVDWNEMTMNEKKAGRFENDHFICGNVPESRHRDMGRVQNVPWRVSGIDGACRTRV